MREIELHSKKYPGLAALVDDDDFELVSGYRWHPLKSFNTFYVQAHTRRDDGRETTIRMHKLLTGHPMTDHKDHNGLNNRRGNLRLATRSQNMANRAALWGYSRYKGVSWHKQNSKWEANIQIDHRQTYLGLFATEIEAALVYDRAAVEAFGEFACTNRMLGLLPSQSDFELAA